MRTEHVWRKTGDQADVWGKQVIKLMCGEKQVIKR